MGCASSKKVCRKCKAPCSPVEGNFSIHHRRKRSGVDPINYNRNQTNPGSCVEDSLTVIGNEETVRAKPSKHELRMSITEAKTWSKMIDKKIPKIALKSQAIFRPGEPEMINVWELMEDLEEIRPLRQVHHFPNSSFHVSPSHVSLASIGDEQQRPIIKEHDDTPPNPQPLPSKPNSNSVTADNDSNANDVTSIISEFDPNEITSFETALTDLPPSNPFHLNPIVGKEKESTNEIPPRGNRDMVTVYFTSLRGFRKTYEDCCYVRVILKGLGVKVDDRDVSMHAGFKEELKMLLGEQFGGLPRVFIGKKYIGGADEIRRLNEEGKLKETLENCKLLDNGCVCESCGDIRFVPCWRCSGSCKVYCTGDYDDEDDKELDEIEDHGFQRCPNCNENGLVRCPICCKNL